MSRKPTNAAKPKLPKQQRNEAGGATLPEPLLRDVRYTDEDLERLRRSAELGRQVEAKILAELEELAAEGDAVAQAQLEHWQRAVREAAAEPG